MKNKKLTKRNKKVTTNSLKEIGKPLGLLMYANNSLFLAYKNLKLFKTVFKFLDESRKYKFGFINNYELDISFKEIIYIINNFLFYLEAESTFEFFELCHLRAVVSNLETNLDRYLKKIDRCFEEYNYNTLDGTMYFCIKEDLKKFLRECNIDIESSFKSLMKETTSVRNYEFVTLPNYPECGKIPCYYMKIGNEWRLSDFSVDSGFRKTMKEAHKNFIKYYEDYLGWLKENGKLVSNKKN